MASGPDQTERTFGVEKIYNGNSLWFDTGFFFSSERNRNPDIVMVNHKEKKVNLMDGRNDYAVTSIPFNGVLWNVKVLPFLNGSRDGFVVAASESTSLFWSFQWRKGQYEVRKETGYAGNYGHPMDGTFTIADVDGDGELECIVPDSSPYPQSQGLSYLKAVPANENWLQNEIEQTFSVG